MNKNIISFTLRAILGLNFLFVAIAHLKLWKFYTYDTDKITSWITSIGMLGNCIAIGLLITSLFLLLGYKTVFASIFSIFILLINHVALLFTKPSTPPINGPFYNTFYHSVPLILFCILLMYSFSASAFFSVDNFLKQNKPKLGPGIKEVIILLTARIFVGTIFLSQGLHIFMREGSIIQFAETVYVKSFDSTFIPNFLLWIMGVSNPFILLIGGILLIIGFKIKWSASILSFFMISIIFGHLLGDPYETSGDISMYAFNNLVFIILVLWFENKSSKFSIDYFFKKVY